MVCCHSCMAPALSVKHREVYMQCAAQHVQQPQFCSYLFLHIGLSCMVPVLRFICFNADALTRGPWGGQRGHVGGFLLQGPNRCLTNCSSLCTSQELLLASKLQRILNVFLHALQLQHIALLLNFSTTVHVHTLHHHLTSLIASPLTISQRVNAPPMPQGVTLFLV